MATELDVQFEDEIPSIKREGFTRGSKYDPLLDKVAESGKVAVLTLESQGAASSRASSIKNAAEKRDEEFEVATRSVPDSEEVKVYVSVVTNDEGSDEKPKKKRKKKSS